MPASTRYSISTPARTEFPDPSVYLCSHNAPALSEDFLSDPSQLLSAQVIRIAELRARTPTGVGASTGCPGWTEEETRNHRAVMQVQLLGHYPRRGCIRPSERRA